MIKVCRTCTHMVMRCKPIPGDCVNVKGILYCPLPSQERVVEFYKTETCPDWKKHWNAEAISRDIEREQKKEKELCQLLHMGTLMDS